MIDIHVCVLEANIVVVVVCYDMFSEGFRMYIQYIHVISDIAPYQ